jgi:hypothetical protein
VEHQGELARLGTAGIAAWNRVTQKVHRRTGGFEDWPPGEPMPLVPGTLIRLRASRAKAPVWLWAGEPDAGDALVRVLWQAYLRRFDIERGKPDCCHKRVRLSSSGLPSVSELVLAS